MSVPVIEEQQLVLPAEFCWRLEQALQRKDSYNWPMQPFDIDVLKQFRELLREVGRT